MGNCYNCGTRLSDGYCPNCEEEAFITETQAAFLPEHLSEDFTEAVERQRAAKQRRDSTASKAEGA